MRFAIFHKKDPDFGISWMGKEAPDDVKIAEFDKVAEVICDELGDTFRITNHIDKSWQENEEVVFSVPRARSTSVGDIVIDSTGLAFLCDHSGWKRISIVDAASQWDKIWEKSVSEAVNSVRKTRIEHRGKNGS